MRRVAACDGAIYTTENGEGVQGKDFLSMSNQHMDKQMETRRREIKKRSFPKNSFIQMDTLLWFSIYLCICEAIWFWFWSGRFFWFGFVFDAFLLVLLCFGHRRFINLHNGFQTGGLKNAILQSTCFDGARRCRDCRTARHSAGVGIVICFCFFPYSEWYEWMGNEASEMEREEGMIRKQWVSSELRRDEEMACWVVVLHARYSAVQTEDRQKRQKIVMHSGRRYMK
ncbi:hypothetical protein EYC84_008524 [Monilinia fructicola]|uniref:Uncharacterized protein n=1 Tax=Monilinia fructicola TaxID=38448 RepID=A0A5M9JJX4_MONFR|nr:hypothetical protein EYC84_008524 [Monilinia fructicola]